MTRNIFTGLKLLLFPPICPVCRARLPLCVVPGLCSSCREHIAYMRPPFCLLCGKELAGDPLRRHRCGNCLRLQPPYSVARSVLHYEPCIGRLLQRLKYHGDTSVVPAVVELIKGLDFSQFSECQLILPVPLHVERHRHRGYNQAALLARAFFPDRGGDIVGNVLLRIRQTPAQTSLSGEQRRKNLSGAFALRPGMRLAGRVCLVDDVFTTGSTVSECAKTLLRGGAQEVRVLTLARADRL